VLSSPFSGASFPFSFCPSAKNRAQEKESEKSPPGSRLLFSRSVMGLFLFPSRPISEGMMKEEVRQKVR